MKDKAMKIIPSDICTAFGTFGVTTIGSKVSSPEFMFKLEVAISCHDFTKDRIPGQACLNIPGAIPFVSSGYGRRQPDVSAYVLHKYRGRVSMFLRREFAAPTKEVLVVVYTKEAYLNDPDIDESGEQEAIRIKKENPDYVIVAVLASPFTNATLSPYRFVKNLAGGNHEALAWTANEIRAKARDIANFDDTWCVVAD